MKRVEELGISQAPWRVVEIGSPLVIVANDDIFVCEIHYIREDQNARLIASAPELYESLAAFVSWYERNAPLPFEENGIQMIVHYAKQALAKAAGEEVA